MVGVPDPVKGEVPLAVIELRSGTTATAEEIRAFCRHNISSYKIPAYVVFRKGQDLPRTATGKVQKTRLREEMTALMEQGGLGAGGEGQG